jgi:ketosteroid isomerase-like protein
MRDTSRAMSQENVALVERYWRATDRALESHWAHGGSPLSERFRSEGLYDILDPETEWITTWAPEPFRGEAELLRATDDWTEAGTEWRIRAEEITPGAGDCVLTVLRVSIRGSGSGVPIEQLLYTVCRIRDGRIMHIHDFVDRDEARRTAGMTG